MGILIGMLSLRRGIEALIMNRWKAVYFSALNIIPNSLFAILDYVQFSIDYKSNLRNRNRTATRTLCRSLHAKRRIEDVEIAGAKRDYELERWS